MSIMDAVAKAGITEGAVMAGVGNLDVDRLLWYAERHDRHRGATGAHLQRRRHGAQFLLKILPSMLVPDLDGVREGMV